MLITSTIIERFPPGIKLWSFISPPNYHLLLQLLILFHVFLFNRFFELFKKYDGYRTGHLKLKKPKQLQEVLDIARFLLDEHHANSDPEIAEKKVKLQQLKLVLEMCVILYDLNHKMSSNSYLFYLYCKHKKIIGTNKLFQYIPI